MNEDDDYTYIDPESYPIMGSAYALDNEPISPTRHPMFDDFKSVKCREFGLRRPKTPIKGKLGI